MNIELKKLQTIIGYDFNDTSLLKKAMTHRSYASEKKLPQDNQRLEFLGDAVVEIIVTEYLFKLYQDKQEGELTALRSALVQKNTLAKLAQLITLQNFIFLGKGEIEAGGNNRNSTLCDAFEALIGAVYLDSDLETTRKFLLRILTRAFPNLDNLLEELNPKGVLQEITQKRWNVKPEYKIKGVTGPQHDIIYVVEAYISGKLYGSGEGKNRKSAESEAARNTISLLS